MKERIAPTIVLISLMGTISCTKIKDTLGFTNLAEKIIAFETECPLEKLQIQDLGEVSYDERINSTLNRKVSFFGCGFKGIYHCKGIYSGEYSACMQKYINVRQELDGNSDDLQKAIHTYFASDPGRNSLTTLMKSIQDLDEETKKILPSYLDFISKNRLSYLNVDVLRQLILLLPISNFEIKKKEMKELLDLLDSAKFESRSILTKYFDAENSSQHTAKLKKMLEIAEEKNPKPSSTQ